MKVFLHADIKSHYRELACNFPNGYKVSLLKKADETFNYPLFCITTTKEVDTEGKYINEEIFSWYIKETSAIQAYTKHYGTLLTKGVRK